MHLTVWQLQGEAWDRAAVEEAFPLVPTGDAAATGADGSSERPLLVPVAAGAGVVAVLLIPAAWGGRIAVGGVPMPAGLHPIRDRDRMELEGRTLWVSAERTAVETGYDPALHGGDAFCFLTKARLQAGEAIVLCPGTPDGECGQIARAEAWQAAASTDAFRCPSCGFDPQQTAWEPPPPQPGRSLNELFELARPR